MSYKLVYTKGSSKVLLVEKKNVHQFQQLEIIKKHDKKKYNKVHSFEKSSEFNHTITQSYLLSRKAQSKGPRDKHNKSSFYCQLRTVVRLGAVLKIELISYMARFRLREQV